MNESRGPGLTQHQAVLVTMEVESSVNLLRDGRTALRTMTFALREADTTFTLLSLGVEKLLKLSVGLAALEETGNWPGRKLRGYLHKVVELDSDVRELMTAGVGRISQPAYLERAVLALEADTVWPNIREGLDRYGSGGRYHYLDWVTGQPPLDSPRGYWNKIETEALLPHPAVRALFGSTAPGDFEEARRKTNDAMVASLNVWWSAVHEAWQQGALGAEARAMSSGIDPQGVFAR